MRENGSAAHSITVMGQDTDQFFHHCSQASQGTGGLSNLHLCFGPGLHTEGIKLQQTQVLSKETAPCTHFLGREKSLVRLCQLARSHDGLRDGAHLVAALTLGKPGACEPFIDKAVSVHVVYKSDL